MSKLDELKNMVDALFANAESKGQIESLGAVKAKCDEIQEENQKREDEYKSLLKDYKDVVLHSAYKAESTHNATDEATQSSSFDADKAFSELLAKMN